MAPTKRVLIVCTSNDQLGDTGKKTGCWCAREPFRQGHAAQLGRTS